MSVGVEKEMKQGGFIEMTQFKDNVILEIEKSNAFFVLAIVFSSCLIYILGGLLSSLFYLLLLVIGFFIFRIKHHKKQQV